MEKKDSYFITTPIYYATGNPHLGHSYTSIVGDVISRFQRLLGKEVLFTTGTDEHGQKVVQKAEYKNLTPQEFVDQESQKFSDLTKTLKLSTDYFVRTTNQDHKEYVQKMLQQSFDNGDIYLGEYEGLYCVDCERYYTEDELHEGNVCPDHKKECISMKQENYFFKLSKYQDFLLDLYEKNPNFISPKSKRDEIINRVKGGLQDISISRHKDFLTWGIEFPFDKNHVAYVWFDALFNYTSVGELRGFWPANTHLVGKDISWFHTVYWPAFLKSVGKEIPDTIFIHGLLLDHEGHKMSKSLGNVVDPFVEIKKYGLDEFKYYLMILGSFGEDGKYSNEKFENHINTDLNNDLGNLVSRIHTMTQKYCDNKIPILNIKSLEKVDEDLLNELDISKELNELFDQFEISKAINLIFTKIRLVNSYINSVEPYKVEDQNRREVIMSVLNNCIYHIATLISIIMPQKAQLICDQFGYELKNTIEFNYLEKEVELKEKIQLFKQVGREESKKVESKKEDKSKFTIVDEKRREIKAIVFDFDGVILDCFELTDRMMKKVAPSLTTEEHKQIFEGNAVLNGDKKITKEGINNFFKVYDPEYIKLSISKNVKKELLNLKSQFKLFCVTSNIKSNIDAVLKNSDLEDIFVETLAREDHHCKSEKITSLMKKYEFDKDEVLFVTDTLGDVREAHKIDVQTIAIDSGFHERKRLQRGVPYKIVSSFKQVRKEIDNVTKNVEQEIEFKFGTQKGERIIRGTRTTLHPTQKNTKLALFVHGFLAHRYGCKSKLIREQLLGVGFDFVTFDFLECGRGDKISDKYPISLQSQIDQVQFIIKELVEKFGYQEIILIGHSLGGLNVLSQKNKLITKKIAIAPVTHSRSKEELIERFVNGDQNKLEELEKNKQLLIDDDYGKHMISKELITDLTQVSTSKLQKITNSGNFETLILQGTNDVMVPHQGVEEFIKGAYEKYVDVLYVKEATHSFKDNTFEQNEQFLSKLRLFIENGIEVKPLNFSDLRLQMGKIIEVDNHPDADKLYVEKVDFGEFGVRQIVSGLKKYFTKEEMIGKTVLALTNLKTANFRGVESQGMLLLAESSDGENLSFLEVDDNENLKLGSFASLDIVLANSENEISFDKFIGVKLESRGGEIYFNSSDLSLNIENTQIKLSSTIGGQIR